MDPPLSRVVKLLFGASLKEVTDRDFKGFDLWYGLELKLMPRRFSWASKTGTFL